MLNINNRNTRTSCEICSKSIIKAAERRQHRSGAFIVNFEHISHLVLHLFFNKQSIFDPRPEICLSFSKKSPQKLFSNCLVDGLLTSIV